MSTHIYIQLGKLGDILNILPVCWHDFNAGLRPMLMVARKYADILDGVTYVDKLVFEGEAHELEKAVEQAKTFNIPWKVTQVCGPPEATRELVYKRTKEFQESKVDHAVTDSWQKESYRAAGHWALWRKQPKLVFDSATDAAGQELLTEYAQPRRKAIIIACDGETAPPPFRDLLIELVTLRYKKRFQIINLSDVKAERFYDIKHLFDKALCLIASDSAPLHLAQSSKVPVLALANDKPSLWHGSSWRPNHAFYCRYRDFAARAMDMVTVIDELGDFGSYFQRDTSKPAIFHMWSQYDITPENREAHGEARKTWKTAYRTGQWVETRIDLGSCGRDSAREPVKDSDRYPFVRDAIQMPELRSQKGDTILWTSAVARFSGSLSKISEHPMGYAYRIKNGTYEPAVDLFWFPVEWWVENRKKYPDMIMGPDRYWSRAIKEMLRGSGAVDATGVVQS